MALTEIAVKKAKFDPSKKVTKIFDNQGTGLYLEVTEKGSKYFRLQYIFAGKQKVLALGVYPKVSLKEAREKALDANKLVANGINPVEYKRHLKKNRILESDNSFKAVATEWFTKFSPQWAESHSSKKWRRLELYIFPFIGDKPIKHISSLELLEVLRKVEARGKNETVKRTRNVCGEVFRYAIAAGKADNDPSIALKGALAPAKTKHMATITEPKAIGELLRAIDGYSGSYVVQCALRLTPLVFVRPGELRQAEWSEIDFDEAVWKIPAEKMKAKREHLVPLSKQAMKVLRDIEPYTRQWKYVFPSERGKDRPMSNATITAALRRMDYSKEEMTAHGFRAIASTLLHESCKYDSDVIEMQLAHVERNKVKASYNHAKYKEIRAEMMQWWADYLDGLKRG